MEICPHGARIVVDPNRGVQFIDVCVPCENLLVELSNTTQRRPEDTRVLV